MEIESTLKFFNEADIEGRPRRDVPGQVMKPLIGRQTPTERIALSLGNFKPGTFAPLHWHLVEKVYYVTSGHAIVRDIKGKAYNLGPGSFFYVPPGPAAAHSWEAIDQMQLLSITANSQGIGNFNIIMDENTKQSSLDIKVFLEPRDRTTFKKSLYVD